MDIRTVEDYNDELRQISAPIADSKEKKEIADVLNETLSAHTNAVGLAAPQLGYHKRVIALKPVNSSKTTILFNPKIVQVFGQQVSNEGCLSVPGVEGLVKRADHVTVIHDNGSQEFDGFMARAVQHEIDHLDGILFIDRLENYE